MNCCRSKQDFEKEILQHIERTTKVINHSMINQDALILATAEKDDVDLEKYKQQVLKDIDGELLLMYLDRGLVVPFIVPFGILLINVYFSRICTFCKTSLF